MSFYFNIDPYVNILVNEQKISLYNLSTLTWFIYISYFFMAFTYFSGILIPFISTVALVIIVISDYVVGMRNVNQAETLKDAVKNTFFSKLGVFLNLIIMAIHVAYLL